MPELPLDHRRALLGQAIAQWVHAGARVESQSDTQAVMVTGKQPNHVLHLLLTIFTALLWAPVWIIVSIVSKERRTVLTVDPWGNVLTQQ